jgi:NADH dehydrogenase FAD-containing subunit
MEQASNAKYVVVVVGGGAGGIKFLQAAAKLSDDVKSQLDIVIIDTKDYNETPVSMQRFLTQPEKARYATLPYSEVLQAVGIGRFIQGRVVKVSKAKNRVR